MSCGVELYGKILLENGVLPFVSCLRAFNTKNELFKL